MLRHRTTGRDMQDLDQLTIDLVERHGELVSQRDLARMLGYPSVAAIAKARERGRLPIKTFGVPGRRGKFAFTRDVSAWLFSMRSGAAGDLECEDGPGKGVAM